MPISPRTRANLEQSLGARHVVFIGGQHMESAIALCRRIGFDGRISVVNPTRDRLGGVACVPTLADLDEVPEVAMLGVSAERSIELTRALRELGVKGVVCHAAGFAELGPAAAGRQRALVEAAGEIALIGPNCMGFINNFDRIAVWGSDNHTTALSGRGVAIVSQSGAFLYNISNVETTLPLGYAISVGNQAVLGAGDFVDVLLDDRRVCAIGLYLEGLSDGRTLGSALARALREETPVVLLKGGGTDASARLSVSHTGALAIPNDYWRALVDRYALLEVGTPKELVETLKMIACAGVPRGNRFFAASFSGALGTLLADRAPAEGLVFSEVSAAGHEKLRPRLPAEMAVSNPLDMNLPWVSKHSISLEHREEITDCLASLAGEEPDVLAVFADIPSVDPHFAEPWLPTMGSITELPARLGIPCVMSSVLPRGLPLDIEHDMLRAGVAPLHEFAHALKAIGLSANYRRRREEALSDGEPAALLPESQVPRALRPLDELQSRALLADYGLPMLDTWDGDASEAPEAAARMGFPLVLKIVSAAIAHKSRIGAVVVGLEDQPALTEALREISANVARHGLGPQEYRFMLEPMVEDVRDELFVGVKRHPSFGLVLLFGRGGTDIEALREYRSALLPVGERELSRLLEEWRVSARYSAPLKAALHACLLGITRFALDHAEELAELDVNPLLVRESEQLAAVDALVVLSQNGASADGQ